MKLSERLIVTGAAIAVFVAGFLSSRTVSSVGAEAPESFHRWYYEHGAQTWFNSHWLGVQIEKTPWDMWTYQEILQETKPDVLIECGTAKGGSAYYFATMFDLLKHGRVITIDIESDPGRPAHPRITYLVGSSTSDAIVRAVRDAIKPGERVMVSLDSDHRKAHVADELRLYSPMVTPGQYLVVEDTDINGHPVLPLFGPGPMEAVTEFLPKHPEFKPDAYRERFGVSFFPHGWLKRVPN
jgi:cephalosporin hydroxylase